MRLVALALPVALLAQGEARQQAQTQPQPSALRGEFRSVTAPDGTVFFLVPSPGTPIVFLASATACGPADEPTGLAGLSRAVERAAFYGTFEIGGKDRAEEEAILNEEDQVCAEVARLRRAGKEPAQELLKKLGSVRARADVLADRFEFGRRLNALAASEPRIEALADGTIVTTSFPAESLGAVLELMRARRDRACMRGFQREFERVREELAREERADPLRRSRAEVLSLAFKRHPYGRVLDSTLQPGISCARARALAFWQEHHQPERTFTVLAGGFDVMAVEDKIREVHAEKGSVTAQLPDVPGEPDQEGERIGQLPPQRPELLCIGYRVPRSVRRPHVDVLGRLLGAGPASLLWKRLIEQGVAVGGQVLPAFPGRREAGLFVIDVALTPGKSPEPARDEVYRLLAALAEQGPPEEDLARAKAAARADLLRKIADPESLASLLAAEAIVDGTSVDLPRLVAEYEAIGGSALREAASALFKTTRRTVVFSLTEGGAPR